MTTEAGAWGSVLCKRRDPALTKDFYSHDFNPKEMKKTEILVIGGKGSFCNSACGS